MDYISHCQECLSKLGKTYGEVHKYLDEFAGKPGIGMRHRKYRHHQAGIIEVGRKFGEDAMSAARLHIVSDLKMEGWAERDHFPQNEQDYVRMGLY
jgi:hypothetical protein